MMLNMFSCLSALLSVVDIILNLLREDKACVDMVYIHYAKALDDHLVLLHKIRDFNIYGHLGKWFANLLSDRTQHVRLKDNS